jgi:hypothetical protein
VTAPNSFNEFKENVMLGKCALTSISAGALVLALAIPQQAQAQRRGGMGMRPAGVNPLGLVTNEAVQKDLGVKEDQTSKLKDLSDDINDERRQLVEGAGIDFRGLRDLSGEEREKRMAEIQTKMKDISKQINDKFRPQLEKTLSKDQLARLQEIAIQAAGPQALEDANVAKDLGLSKEQQDKIAGIDKDFAKKLGGLRGRGQGGGGDASERMAKMKELHDEQLAKATEVLSADQQAKFTKLKGKTFDTAKLRQFGRRRRSDS